MKKELTFEIEHRAYKIKLDTKDAELIEKEITKHIPFYQNKSITIGELLRAFISQSYHIIKTDKALTNLSNIIDENLDD